MPAPAGDLPGARRAPQVECDGSFSPSRDEDIDYQARLLGTAKVEMVILAQTSASLFTEDYDDVVTKRLGSSQFRNLHHRE